MQLTRCLSRRFSTCVNSLKPLDNSSLSVERKRLTDVTIRLSESSASSELTKVDQPTLSPLWKHDADAIYSGKDQVLYPASQEEIEILSRNKNLFSDPQKVQDSIIIRIVSLADPVTSPVGRVFRNRQFGIRDDEGYQVLATGLCISALLCSLGFWQLRRMEFKRKTIELRRDRMAQPLIACNQSPFPWSQDVASWEHRQVQVRGMFDSRREILIGPRPISFVKDHSSPVHDSVGYLVITPLLLQDGSQLLVNRGFLPLSQAKDRKFDAPQWVNVRGVLSCGELPGGREWWRLPNNVADRKFLYADPYELATATSISRNFREASQAFLIAFEVIPESGEIDKSFKMKHRGDILAVYGDEHTHLWYAVQWFLSAGLLTTMTLFRWVTYFRKYRW